MAMHDYYVKFYVQEFIKKPTGFPPPFDFEYIYADGVDIYGLFVQDSSSEMLIAGAQGLRTRGRFATCPNVPLRDGEIVRRESDNVFIRIIGDAKQSPEQAESQIKLFTAEITERPAP
jgi:hypothetical protein